MSFNRKNSGERGFNHVSKTELTLEDSVLEVDALITNTYYVIIAL